MVGIAERAGKERQRGSVLLLVTFSLLAILGFAALALDVSRMYVIKSQLQDAADAGALRAAKELDGTGAGVQTALAKGIESALTNSFLLVSEPLTSGDITVEVSTAPAGPWVDAAGVSASASNDYFFARVTAGKQGIAGFFGGLLGVFAGAANAVAVAGETQLAITPLAMCAPNWNDCPMDPENDHTPPPGGTCGFVPGLAYRVGDLNPVSPGTPLWIDPLASAAPCTVTSANATRPYVCIGKVAISANAKHVFTNSGLSGGPLFAALDSRFGDYASAAQCDPATAPPDRNVKQYFCTNNPDSHAAWQCKTTAKASASDQMTADWMTFPIGSPAEHWGSSAGAYSQAAVVDSTTQPMTSDRAGVVWSFRRPEEAPINPERASGSNSNYPASPSTPYTASGSTKYWASPAPGTPGTPCANRRVLNVVLVHCQAVGGNCRQAAVGGFGQFLMTRKADMPGDRDVYVEFGGMSRKNVISANIKLYR